MNPITEKRRAQARALRFKKCIIKELDLDIMRFQCEEMMSWADTMAFEYDEELERLIGDDYEEFKVMCASLSADLQRFKDDLENCINEFEWMQENGSERIYQDMTVALVRESTELSLIGYDSCEGDYFGLDGMERQGVEEAEKRLLRFKKGKIIQAAHMCMAVSLNYMSLRSRYDNLQTSVDVLTAGMEGLSQFTNKINESYEAAYGTEPYAEWKKWGYGCPSSEMRHFESLLNNIDPYSKVWIE